MSKNLKPVGMYGLLTLEFLKEFPLSTKKDILRNVKIRKDFSDSFENVMEELEEFGYVKKSVINNRKSYELVD